MSSRRVMCKRIECTHSIEGATTGRMGFQVTGYKEFEPQLDSKVGFIVSGVIVLSFQQTAARGIRTRVKWIPDGFEIREEIRPLDGRMIDTQRRNNVIFVSREEQSSVIMQGEPIVQENTFMGQLLQVDWRWEEDQVIIKPLSRTLDFYCSLDSKNNRVDCLLK